MFVLVVRVTFNQLESEFPLYAFLALVMTVICFGDFGHRIEGHAEHGGTLNEHQLTRLVPSVSSVRSSRRLPVDMQKERSVKLSFLFSVVLIEVPWFMALPL